MKFLDLFEFNLNPGNSVVFVAKNGKKSLVVELDPTHKTYRMGHLEGDEPKARHHGIRARDIVQRVLDVLRDAEAVEGTYEITKDSLGVGKAHAHNRLMANL